MTRLDQYTEINAQIQVLHDVIDQCSDEDTHELDTDQLAKIIDFKLQKLHNQFDKLEVTV
jgi:hypothetical protein